MLDLDLGEIMFGDDPGKRLDKGGIYAGPGFDGRRGGGFFATSGRFHAVSFSPGPEAPARR